MKKLLYTLLAVSIIFSACEEEDAAPTNTNNNNNNNNSSGTIADVVGVWKFEGVYDISGNQTDAFNNIADENCRLQSNFVLQSDGSSINQSYYLENDNSGPCLYQTTVCDFEYINSTTLQFLVADLCASSIVVTIVNNIEARVPVCIGDEGVYDGSRYMLYVKQ